ncbi:MAG: hypothetical protein IPP57_18190 [Candidatus Obscuribacter sp.]|nr:hypothetical protein [Candidatus Obscuribacter sp.]
MGFGLKLSSVCLTLIVAAPIFRIIILGLLVQTNNLKSMKELEAEIEAAQKLASSKSGSTTTTTTTTKDTEQNTGTSELTARARGFQDRLFISRDTLPLISIGGFKYIKASYLPGLRPKPSQACARTAYCHKYLTAESKASPCLAVQRSKIWYIACHASTFDQLSNSITPLCRPDGL